MFIKLTSYATGKEFMGNVNLLQRVFVTAEGRSAIVGWQNNGYFEVVESYDEIMTKIENAISYSHKGEIK